MAMSINIPGKARLKLSTFTRPESTNISKVSHTAQHGLAFFVLLGISTAGCENLPLPAGLRKTASMEIKQGQNTSTGIRTKEGEKDSRPNFSTVKHEVFLFFLLLYSYFFLKILQILLSPPLSALSPCF